MYPQLVRSLEVPPAERRMRSDPPEKHIEFIYFGCAPLLGNLTLDGIDGVG